jgi:hypothetical protein
MTVFADDLPRPDHHRRDEQLAFCRLMDSALR